MREWFEKALFENPDDLTTYHAFADWLMEQNDPRGEFIQLQLDIENCPEESTRKELRKRSRKLQELHERDWLGSLSRFLLGRGSEEYSYIFSRGFLHTLHVRNLRVTTAESLIRSSAAGLLRELRVHQIHRESLDIRRGRKLPENDRCLGLYPLLMTDRLKNLHTIQIGQTYPLPDGKSREPSMSALIVEGQLSGNLFCQLLARGELKKQFEAISLHCEITNEGARQLLLWKGIHEVKHLDLSRNRLTPSMVAEIRQVRPDTILSNQYRPIEALPWNEGEPEADADSRDDYSV